MHDEGPSLYRRAGGLPVVRLYAISGMLSSPGTRPLSSAGDRSGPAGAPSVFGKKGARVLRAPDERRRQSGPAHRVVVDEESVDTTKA